MEKYVKVVEAYNAMYPDPIIVRAGEELKVGSPDPEQPDWFWCEGPDGKRGWVPKDYIEDRAARCDYSAVELSASEGERLLLMKEIYGWAYCENESGNRGWIPTGNLGSM